MFVVVGCLALRRDCIERCRAIGSTFGHLERKRERESEQRERERGDRLSKSGLG